MSWRNAAQALLTGLISIAASNAFAWGDIGHSTVGYIAEKNLTPQARAMVYDIVGSEPLTFSAMFPDHVRSDDRFRGFSPFHFYEIPPGYKFKTMPDTLRAISDTQTMVEQVPAMLIKKDLPVQERAIVYRYLIHVLGDIHQPLHVGNGLDMGANLCLVKWTNPETKITELTNLHTVWDENIIDEIGAIYKKAHPPKPGSKRWFNYKELGDMVIQEFSGKEGMSLAEASSAPPDAWYDDSRALHPAAYPETPFLENPAERTYCRIVDKKTNKVVDGKFNESTIPLLSQDFINASMPIVKKQIMLAGLRLAGILNKTAENYERPRNVTETKRSAALAKSILKNKNPNEVRQPQGKKSKKAAEPFPWREQLPYSEDLH
jgi:hypothetical protein